MKKQFITSALLAITLLVYPSINIAAQSEVKQTNQSANSSQFELINTSINKSPNDKAIYQAIKLANGMEVLLISDEQANKSLMSVALPVGSMEDPMQQQGLAHYLEHMILMGSKNFPETNSLDGFLTKNGGYNNAYTAPDRTVYYLEVNNDAFDEAVTRLADAFAAPLLLESNAKKEVNAVNAEMVRAKSNDGFLMHDVNLATANPNHPITKFAVGNNVTLSDKAESLLQTELINFYQQYYSANITKAVLYSNQPIEALAKLAEKTLGKMENKNITPPTVSVPFFREEDKEIIISYKPVKPNKLLVISFDMPEDKSQFKHKSGEYLSYVFANNSEGTLSDYLIKQGLSDSGIEAAASDDVSRNSGDFSFYIELTDKGLKNTDKIISLVFQLIEKVKNEGIQESYANELKESLTQQFQHLLTEKSGRYVAQLASQLLNYPLEHIIDQPYIMTEIVPREIHTKLSFMTVENARILLVNENAKTDKKTKYFEAPYSLAKITESQKKQWLDFSRNPRLQLPELNPYFATDFSLNLVDKSRKIPTLIKQQAGTEIFAMPSQYFASQPKATVIANFSLKKQADNLKQNIAATILSYMNSLAQNKIAYQASIAGMETNIDTSEHYITISAEGYTQHLTQLLKDSLLKFSQFELSEDDLIQAKQRFIESLDKLEKENALRQANSIIQNFSRYPYTEKETVREMISQITLVDIENIRQKLIHQADGLRLFSFGNLSDKQIEELTSELEKIIPNHNNSVNYGRYIDISQSKRKLNYQQQIPHEDNALILAYFPLGYTEIESSANAMLLKDIISRWYFDDLRTDKQLGYVVYATTLRIGKSIGLQFLVQSPTTSPEGIMLHNTRFFNETLTKLTNMTNSEFEQYKQSLLEILQHKPESFSQEWNEFLTDFQRGNRAFDRKIKIIEKVKTLTLADIQNFYKNTIIEQQGFIFASQAIGTNPQINQAVNLVGFENIESIEALQKEFEVRDY